MFRSLPVVAVGGLIAGANYALGALGAVMTEVTSFMGSSHSVVYAQVPQDIQNWLTPIGAIIAITAVVADGWYYLAWNGSSPHRGIKNAPIEKPAQVEKKVEPKAIAPAAVKPAESIWDVYRNGLLTKQKKVVSEIELLVNSLHSDVDKLSNEDAYDYDQIVNRHLPTSLDLYKKAIQRRGDKSEAIELINSQLENMKVGLETIYSHVDEGMLHEMRVQSSFLDTKYAKKHKATVLNNSKSPDRLKR
jgi:hypothetical protein